MAFYCQGLACMLNNDTGVRYSAEEVCELCNYEAGVVFDRISNCTHIQFTGFDNVAIYDVEAIAFVTEDDWDKVREAMSGLPLVDIEPSLIQKGYGYLGRVGNMSFFTDTQEPTESKFIENSFYVKAGDPCK